MGGVGEGSSGEARPWRDVCYCSSRFNGKVEVVMVALVTVAVAAAAIAFLVW